jgi:DNA-binding SARP family transcriptional activator
VKLLALAPHHRLHREQLMDTLWPELAPEAAAANLRKAVHFARLLLARATEQEAAGDPAAAARRWSALPPPTR